MYTIESPDQSYRIYIWASCAAFRASGRFAGRNLLHS